MAELTRWFSESRIEHTPTVGGKGASLGEMFQNLSALGVRVPNGFTLTTEAFHRFISSKIPSATWNNVGNVLYDEGIVVLKTPHLFYFNKDETNITFKGEQNLHTLILNVPAFANMQNSSSNPTFKTSSSTFSMSSVTIFVWSFT